MLSTKVASLRDTPWASATPATVTRTAAARSGTSHARALATCDMKTELVNGSLIPAMARVAGVVQPFAGGQQRLDVLLLSGFVRLPCGGRHRIGHPHPVIIVFCPAVDLEQVGGLDQRQGIAADVLPLLIIAGKHLFRALLADRRRHGVVDGG